MRKDLKMRRGKEIAQGAHASMSFLATREKEYLLNDFGKSLTEEQKEWLKGSFTKVCVQVNSEQELFEIHQKALDAGLESHLITDNGTTEFNGVATPTCCAIGPHDNVQLTLVTGHLKLY